MEYALIASLIAVVALVGIVYLGRSLAGSYQESTVAIGAAVGEAQPAAQADAEPVDAEPAEAEPVAAAAPVSVYVTEADSVVTEYARWVQVGRSGNYNWECANGFNLGRDQDVRHTPVAPGPAPACG